MENTQDRTPIVEQKRVNGININFSTSVDLHVEKVIEDMFEYHAWDERQRYQGAAVRNALMAAARVIVENVPPGPDRTVAIRKIREARMDCNSAITHGGKY